MCHCVAPAPASAAFLDLNDEDSDVDFTAPVAAMLEVPEGQMLDLNEDDGDDDDDVSDYYTITTYCQNGLRINGSCQSCVGLGHYAILISNLMYFDSLF